MIPLPELLASAVTSVQKLVFVIYIAISLWTGFLVDYCTQVLRPNCSTNWFKYLMLIARKDGCNSFWGISTSPSCIREIFFKEESDVYTSAVCMAKSSKWQYLLIVKTLQLLGPYVFMASFFLLPVCGVMLLVNITRKILLYLGCDNAWGVMRESFVAKHLVRRWYNSKLEDVMYLCFGFVASSGFACLLYPTRLSEACETPMCLYCYPRLVKTIFQEYHEDSRYQNLGIASRLTFRAMTLVSTAVFESLLFASTIVFLCMLVYLAYDACWSIWRNFGPQWTREDIKMTWNQCVTSVKGLVPISGVMPLEGEGYEIDEVRYVLC